MIKFKPKVDADQVSPKPASPAVTPAKTVDGKPAGGKTPDSDGKMRRMRQTQDDNRLL